jgi:hypothetical protein
MELFRFIRDAMAVFSPLRDRVLANLVGDHMTTDHVRRYLLGFIVAFFGGYDLFCYDYCVNSQFCLRCWIQKNGDGMRNGLLCPSCLEAVWKEEEDHKMRVLLIGQLPMIGDVTGRITAAYCATVDDRLPEGIWSEKGDEESD